MTQFVLGQTLREKITSSIYSQFSTEEAAIMLRNVLLSSVLGLSMIASANADVLSIDFNAAETYFGPPIDGSLNANFTDVTGGVELTITSNITNSKSLIDLVLNFNPMKSASDLSFAFESDVGGTTGPAFRITNTSKIASSGLFDIDFEWSSLSPTFINGEVEKYFITGDGQQVFASDLDYLSDCTNQQFPCTFGAHLASTSFWDGKNVTTVAGTIASNDPPAVPEPASMLVLGTGLIGLVAGRKYLS